MSASKTLANLSDYLRNHSAKTNITHTRIGDKELNIYGGSYSIENDDSFYDLYSHKVFVKN